MSVSAIGLGTWQLCAEWGHSFSQAEVDAILDEASACGINLVDTAECYGDHLSEALIGNRMARQHLGQKEAKGPSAAATLAAIGAKDPLPAQCLSGHGGEVIAVKFAVAV